MRYNKKKALADNVNAIETALAVHGQGRQATDSEKKTLALYSGFGGIKEVLNIGTDKPMPDGMAEPMKRLQEILLAFAKSDITEYKTLIDSIKSSVLTAFYTPPWRRRYTPLSRTTVCRCALSLSRAQGLAAL